jgi:hypothetical protein
MMCRDKKSGPDRSGPDSFGDEGITTFTGGSLGYHEMDANHLGPAIS